MPCCDSVLFGYGRAVFETDEAYEGDFGGGYRRRFGCAVVGGYAFYDIRRSYNDRFYQAVNVGADLYTRCFEARINGYFPVTGDRNLETISFFVEKDDQIFPFFLCKDESALCGLDAEVGYRFFPCGCSCGCPEIRGVIGGYYFDRSQFKSYGGPKGRVEVAFNPRETWRLTVGVEGQYDRVRAGNVFGYLRVTLPFSTIKKRSTCLNNCPSDLCSRLYHRVERMDMITRTRRQERMDPTPMPIPEFFFKGRPVFNIVTVDGATPNIAATVGGAGVNSLVVLCGNAGDIDLISQGNSAITMPTGQTIAGGGTVLDVVGPDGVPTMLVLDGTRGSIVDSPNFPMINLSTDATIVNIEASITTNVVENGTMIVGDGTPRVMIFDSTIESNFSDHNLIDLINGSDDGVIMNNILTSAMSSCGVLIEASDNVEISGNTFFSQNDAIDLISTTNVLVLSNDIIAGNIGIEFLEVGAPSNNSALVSGNTINAVTGISLAASVEPGVAKNHIIQNNNITATALFGITAGTGQDASILGNVINAPTGISLMGVSTGQTYAITGNSIPSPNTGLLFNGTTAAVNNNTINGAGTVADVTGSTLSGSGNAAVPFSCVDGGGNTGSISFNGGANTCP